MHKLVENPQPTFDPEPPEPDNDGVINKSRQNSRIPVTVDMIETLLSHRERTGMGFGALLRGRKDRPKGVSSGVMYNVARGLNQTVDKDIYDYFIALYEALDESIPLTPEMVQAMQAEAERTGVNIKMLVDRSADVPCTLKPARAKHLLYGEQSTIFRNEHEFIVEAYAAIPTPASPQKARGLKRTSDKPSLEFALGLPRDLMNHVDDEVRRLGYTSRVECIRQLIRQDMIDEPSLATIKEYAAMPFEDSCKSPNVNMRMTLTPPLDRWTERRADDLAGDTVQYIRLLISANRYN